MVPFVEMGKANPDDGWLVGESDGISVYYRPGLRTINREIKISTYGSWLFKTLQVTGIAL